MWVRLDLSAQVLDVGVDRALKGFQRVPADGGQQLGPAEHAPRLPRHRRQQLEFGRRQLDSPAGDRQGHGRHHELDVAHADQITRGLRGFAATEHRAYARDQLLGTERLGHVVIGTQLEADQLVGLSGAGGQHDDGHGPVAAERSSHVEAVDAW